jgi:hypothetical protein
MIKINDGSYGIHQVMGHDDSGGEILGKPVGYFEIIDGKVTRKTGIADEMLQLGSVEGINTYRIVHTFHNGYLTVIPEDMPQEEEEQDVPMGSSEV